jgi:hypothetical protein
MAKTVAENSAVDVTYRVRCIGCNDVLSHDGTLWRHDDGVGKYFCHASSHGEHTPDLSGRETCELCGSGEGTIGCRLLVPLVGGRWQHVQERFCREKVTA